VYEKTEISPSEFYFLRRLRCKISVKFLKNYGNVTYTLVTNTWYFRFFLVFLNLLFLLATQYSFGMRVRYHQLAKHSLQSIILGVGVLHHQSSCSRAPPSTLISVPQTLTVPSSSYVHKPLSIWSKQLEKIMIIKDICCRLVYIMLCMSPAIALAPIAFLWQSNEELQTYWWDLLLSSLSRTGPCLTKFVQWASTRPDLFPLELCNRLKKLQHETNCHNQDGALRIVKAKGWDIHMDELVDGRPVVLGSGCVGKWCMYRLNR
jgi:hypothetical protein